MPVESWIEPSEAQAMAATATAMIDAALTGSGLAREAYWAAVRKGYNTPYNDPAPRKAPEPAVAIPLTEAPLPAAVMAAAGQPEIRAA